MTFFLGHVLFKISLVCWTNLLCLYRFVRFVNTPEILERVYTTESEILQIEEAIAIQGNNSMGISTVSKYQALLYDWLSALKRMFQ